jgi:S-adenosylmethionine synthetase
MEIDVFVNTADDIERKSVYITLTGTSAEMGDDGSVGRGNRVNGLITPFRGMSLEAAAGKNPVNHVGKIYSVLATHIAEQVVEEYEDIEDVNVTLLSQIGKPIDQPKVASASIISKDYDTVKDKVKYIIDKNLEEITETTNRIVFGQVRVF